MAELRCAGRALCPLLDRDAAATAAATLTAALTLSLTLTLTLRPRGRLLSCSLRDERGAGRDRCKKNKNRDPVSHSWELIALLSAAWTE